MNENFTNTELLIQYLDDELDGVKLESIKKSIDENPAMREELEKLSMAKEAIKSYGLKNKIASVHTEMMQEVTNDASPKQSVVRKLFQYGSRIAAAALILIGLFVGYQYFTASPEKLFNENFEAFALRDNRGTASSPLEDAYKNKNMQEVIMQYNKLNDPQAQDYFLAGNAFLLTNQPNKAIQALLALQLKNKISNEHFFEDDAEYYLAMSYLFNNEPAKAIPLFDKINTDKNHPYHKKITSWFLSKVRRLSPVK